MSKFKSFEELNESVGLFIKAEAEALGKAVAEQLGGIEYEISGDQDSYHFHCYVWYVITEISRAGTTEYNSDNSYSSNIAGPFATEKEAEKRAKELGTTQGDMDLAMMKKWKFKVNAIETPTAFTVKKRQTSLNQKDFTRLAKANLPNYKEIFRDKMGSIQGTKFGLK